MPKKKKKKATRATVRKNPPRGWMRATVVKIVRGKGGVRVMVKKPAAKRRRR